MTQLENYLEYYVKQKAPGYAVLITGAWGTGKTFQVMRAIPESDRYYVSLFGLQSTDEVYAEVLATMFPRSEKIKKSTRKIDDTSIEVPGIITIPAGKILSGFVGALFRSNVKTDRTIIFDDLERCALSIKETLGVINRYIEHHGCRVVVLAHDEKIAEDFSQAKEKIFGQTIAASPDVNSAFDAFTQVFSTYTNRNFIKLHKKFIIDIFNSSEVKSLRVLKHVIEDLIRLHTTLLPKHIQNYDAMKELIGLFTATNLEVRAGRINRDDLKTRTSTNTGYLVKQALGKNKDDLPIPAIVKAIHRYKLVNLESRVIGEDLLASILIDGFFEHSTIQESLDESAFFIKPTEAPAWKIFMQFDDLDDNIVEQALASLKTQFANRTITSYGELLHIFSLRFMMVENSLIAGSLDDVEKDCKLYVDDILNQNRIEPLPYNWTSSVSVGRSFGGFAYWIKDTYKQHFNNVVEYFIQARKSAQETLLTKESSHLLELMHQDDMAFFEKITFTNTGENTYASVPIFASVDPQDFVKRWMHAPVKNWHLIQLALNSRYESGLLKSSLQKEAEWIEKVQIEFQKEIESANGIRKLRLQRAQIKNPQE